MTTDARADLARMIVDEYLSAGALRSPMPTALVEWRELARTDLPRFFSLYGRPQKVMGMDEDDFLAHCVRKLEGQDVTTELEKMARLRRAGRYPGAR